MKKEVIKNVTLAATVLAVFLAPAVSANDVESSSSSENVEFSFIERSSEVGNSAVSSSSSEGENAAVSSSSSEVESSSVSSTSSEETGASTGTSTAATPATTTVDSTASNGDSSRVQGNGASMDPGVGKFIHYTIDGKYRLVLGVYENGKKIVSLFDENNKLISQTEEFVNLIGPRVSGQNVIAEEDAADAKDIENAKNWALNVLVQTTDSTNENKQPAEDANSSKPANNEDSSRVKGNGVSNAEGVGKFTYYTIDGKYSLVLGVYENGKKIVRLFDENNTLISQTEEFVNLIGPRVSGQKVTAEEDAADAKDVENAKKWALNLIDKKANSTDSHKQTSNDANNNKPANNKGSKEEQLKADKKKFADKLANLDESQYRFVDLNGDGVNELVTPTGVYYTSNGEVKELADRHAWNGGSRADFEFYGNYVIVRNWTSGSGRGGAEIRQLRADGSGYDVIASTQFDRIDQFDHLAWAKGILGDKNSLDNQISNGKQGASTVSNPVVKGTDATKGQEVTKTKGDKKLPNTGTEVSSLVLMVGAFLLMLGAIFARFTVKKK